MCTGGGGEKELAGFTDSQQMLHFHLTQLAKLLLIINPKDDQERKKRYSRTGKYTCFPPGTEQTPMLFFPTQSGK